MVSSWNFNLRLPGFWWNSFVAAASLSSRLAGMDISDGKEAILSWVWVSLGRRISVSQRSERGPPGTVEPPVEDRHAKYFSCDSGGAMPVTRLRKRDSRLEIYFAIFGRESQWRRFRWYTFREHFISRYEKYLSFKFARFYGTSNVYTSVVNFLNFTEILRNVDTQDDYVVLLLREEAWDFGELMEKIPCVYCDKVCGSILVNCPSNYSKVKNQLMCPQFIQNLFTFHIWEIDFESRFLYFDEYLKKAGYTFVFKQSNIYPRRYTRTVW